MRAIKAATKESESTIQSRRQLTFPILVLFKLSPKKNPNICCCRKASNELNSNQWQLRVEVESWQTNSEREVSRSANNNSVKFLIESLPGFRAEEIKLHNKAIKLDPPPEAWGEISIWNRSQLISKHLISKPIRCVGRHESQSSAWCFCLGRVRIQLSAVSINYAIIFLVNSP